MQVYVCRNSSLKQYATKCNHIWQNNGKWKINQQFSKELIEKQQHDDAIWTTILINIYHYTTIIYMSEQVNTHETTTSNITCYKLLWSVLNSSNLQNLQHCCHYIQPHVTTCMYEHAIICHHMTPLDFMDSVPTRNKYFL